MIHFEQRDKYLLINGEGERKGLKTVEEGTKKIYAFIQESKSRLILIDYRNVNFDLSNTDVFNSIRFYEAKLPLLTTLVVAVVLNKENLAVGKTWTNLGKARGYSFNVFSDFEKAESWLLSQ